MAPETSESSITYQSPTHDYLRQRLQQMDPEAFNGAAIDAECTKCRTSVGATYGEQRMIEILEAAGIDLADAEPNEEIEA